MEKVPQNPYDKYLELQLYDIDEFPNVDVDQYGLVIEKFVAGEIMKSGNPRPKNAISYIMRCDSKREFQECIDWFIEKFVKNEFSLDILKTIKCSQAFVRFQMPAEISENRLNDFSISSDLLKVLLDRGVYLDFWFLR